MKIYKTLKNNSRTNFFLLISLIPLLLNIQSFPQQITGLAGWNIYLDPGHSQNENMGVYGYSEAKKNLRVGLNLRQMLLDWTDIDTVYICRTNDQQIVSLTQRTDQANLLGAAHYHSIHSNATADPTTTANSTLLLWGQLGINGPEKIPHGGKKMSDLMVPLLTAGMRTYTIGSRGDRTFYGGNYSYPYLHVNRETNMASELSEAGFHTNRMQNQLNMNANWKRLEAKTMFWTILAYHNIPRPFVGTVAGIISDIESEQAVNGAVVSINGQTDTTDTWESLFHLYSSDPNLLRNGFYYFEDVPAGTYPLQVTAPGYESISVDVTMADTFFTFKDVVLISNVPPTITSTIPAQNDSLYRGYENVVINFSRQMNKTSVEANLSISPSVTYTTEWSNSDKTLTINTTDFAFATQYQITIGGSSEGKYGHLFDGDGNGVGGDPYTLTIKTKLEDVTSPAVSFVYPSADATNVEYKPIINVSFSELLNTSTISVRFKIIRNSTQTTITGILKHYIVNGRSVLNFFVTTPLVENETYTIKLLSGIEDIFGNQTPIDYTYEFTAGNSNYFSQSLIDNFEGGITNWLQPENSVSTVGIFPLTTNILSSNSVYILNSAGQKLMQLDYDWDTTATDWLIHERYSPAAPTFQPNTLLQVFLFGDGSYNKFRFAVKETAPGNYEVSPWYDVDWLGWKLVTWDLSLGQTGSWVGDGVFDPPLSFDSFQMTYVSGNKSTGTYYFDDVRTAAFSPTDITQENDQVPNNFVLEQNYPNPFNPSTQIKFSLPEATNVKIVITDILGREVTTLVNDDLNAGNYTVNFNASSVSSGVYFYTLITDNFKQSRKMILMK